MTFNHHNTPAGPSTLAVCVFVFLAVRLAGLYTTVKGVNKVDIPKLKLVKVTKRHPEVKRPVQIHGGRDVAEIVKATGLTEEIQEVFQVVHVDARHRLIGVQEVHRGSLTDVQVHPREIFRLAVHAGSAALILVHNHPSGEAGPSPEDVDLTARMVAAGEILGIRVLDSLIVTDSGWVSIGEFIGVLVTD